MDQLGGSSGDTYCSCHHDCITQAVSRPDPPYIAAQAVLRRRHSDRLGHLSWLALPRFGHGMGMRLGSGQAAAVWRSTGAIMGNVVNDFLLFSCMALFVTGIVVAAASLLI